MIQLFTWYNFMELHFLLKQQKSIKNDLMKIKITEVVLIRIVSCFSKHPGLEVFMVREGYSILARRTWTLYACIHHTQYIVHIDVLSLHLKHKYVSICSFAFVMPSYTAAEPWA